MRTKNTGEAKRSVHATVTPEMYERLTKQAEAEERTVSVVVARALRTYLDGKQGEGIAAAEGMIRDVSDPGAAP